MEVRVARTSPFILVEAAHTLSPGDGLCPAAAHTMAALACTRVLLLQHLAPCNVPCSAPFATASLGRLHMEFLVASRTLYSMCKGRPSF